MQNIKKYSLAIAKVMEKLLLIGIGLAGIWAYWAKAQTSDIKFYLIVISVSAFAFGLTPMVINYVKASWPKK